MNNVTKELNFYQSYNPLNLVQSHGSPLYVYNENILRKRCREMKNLCTYPNFVVNYAMKANTNTHIMSIIREEGLRIDASSQGEAIAAMAVGYTANEIMFIVNNVSANELKFAIDHNMTVSVDSLSQLETYGKLNPGGKIALRFNPGIGGGHHEKVVTGGDGTKFGIMPEYIPQVQQLLEKYNLQLVGINHHIGSQNWGDLYLQGVQELLTLAKQFPNLEFIDLGGGFAIPYHKQDGEQPLNLQSLGQSIDKFLNDFAADYGRQITFLIEPGRYIVAECGVLLGTVHALKNCGQTRYAGTDIGFAVMARYALYESHHDIEVYREGEISTETELINIVGNQCESGDYIAKNRCLPLLQEGDVLGVLDTGAYGFSMSSRYNHRPRPAEILIKNDGSILNIRRRETFEDLI